MEITPIQPTRRDLDQKVQRSLSCYHGLFWQRQSLRACRVIHSAQLSWVITSNAMGLYRDNGLAIFRNTSGPGVKQIRKNILKTFQQHGLQVTTEANMIETDFLDITLNLSSSKFWLYRKPNNQPLYIYATLNHPSIIKKHLLFMTAKRVSEISYNEDKFKKAIPL